MPEKILLNNILTKKILVYIYQRIHRKNLDDNFRVYYEHNFTSKGFFFNKILIYSAHFSLRILILLYRYLDFWKTYLVLFIYSVRLVKHLLHNLLIHINEFEKEDTILK